MKRLFIIFALVLPCAAHADASRLDDIIKTGYLRVCTTGDYKPFTYLRPDGQFEGMDIDMAHSLATALGVQARFVKTTWPTLMNDFLEKCDIAMGGVSVTLERQKKAFFSQSHLIDGKAPIARCADVRRFASLADIDQPGTRVIVNPGGTNERFAKANLKRAQLTVHSDNVTIFDKIVRGDADVMITDASETRWQARQHPELCPIHPDKPLQYAEKAYMLPRGDVTLKAFVDTWLQLARGSGEYRHVYETWLGKE
ncbi:transporter substrate-binding domain-containing protein [Noviherbaspirillum pedocola]|uniref:Transporter substrate-binding domain-containing protein n=1 Tax=Noviherbaspirillum pedocola TaxID=2801341 RepID=A0A934T115_9BURK|nr:transporter substrate-binding domain-containing protein [Noviherbaspirillum pedocola]MBK4735458.1 transporter substrate-binding domain-containing protein [Noviherbaspirillum pedocola]